MRCTSRFLKLPTLVLALSLILLTVGSAWAAPPVVSNVRASQRASTGLVDIYYDVADADGDSLFITVAVSTNRGISFNAFANSLSGPGYGSAVTPGNNKQIIWDAGVDWNAILFPNVRVKVTAADGMPSDVKPIENMVWITPGTFTMGSPANELDRQSNEGPLTQVTFTRGFWIGKYEVTSQLYLSLFNQQPTAGGLNPVVDVTWDEARQFCVKLTEREAQAGRLPPGYVYRLPTEAEWEYSARAGTATRFSYGDDLRYIQLPLYAWYSENSGSTPHPVGTKQPNPWGLYDMHGNGFEWCWDWYGNYPGGSVSDPFGPSSGSGYVIRGGSRSSPPSDCRSARRIVYGPGNRDGVTGFRLALGRP